MIFLLASMLPLLGSVNRSVTFVIIEGTLDAHVYRIKSIRLSVQRLVYVQYINHKPPVISEITLVEGVVEETRNKNVGVVTRSWQSLTLTL
jgi:hypothetical protein